MICDYEDCEVKWVNYKDLAQMFRSSSSKEDFRNRLVNAYATEKAAHI